MKEVLIALRRRCAPIRDREIDRQLEGLEILPPKFSHVEVGGGASAIASLITHSLEALMTIIDHMKSDLHDFLLGSMNEEQLGVLLMREAKLRERAVVVQLWSPPSELEDSRRGRMSFETLGVPGTSKLKGMFLRNIDGKRGCFKLSLQPNLYHAHPPFKSRT